MSDDIIVIEIPVETVVVTSETPGIDASSLAVEVAAREAADQALQDQIDDFEAPGGVVSSVNGRDGDVVGLAEQDDLTDEAAARTAADTTLTNAVAAEAATRGTADGANAAAITAEASARANADTTLQNAVTAEIAARAAAVTAEAAARTAAVDVVADALTDEIADRAAGDDDLAAAITAEAVARAAAVTAEATARGNADALLIPLTQKGSAGGVAQLDGSALLPDGIIPAAITRDTELTNAVAAEVIRADNAIAAAIAALIASAPGVLDTLDEIAAALGDDPNFAATITAALAGKQPVDTDLTAIAGLTTTAYGRALLELANAAALTAAINEATGANKGLMSASDKTAFDALAATYQPLDADLTAIAALTTTAFGRGLLEAANAAAGRTALGLGTAATSAVGDFDAAGAAAAAQAASQPVDADLTAIGALTTTAFGRGFLALADAAAARTAIGAIIGTNVQAWDADLDAIAALTTTAYGRALLETANAAAARTVLALGTAATTAAADYQPVDADLTAIAALTTTAFGRGLLELANAAALRTAAGVGTMATETATDYVAKALYDANTILIATADNTPLALGVAASRIVGRKAAGDIDDITGAEAAAILAGEVFKQAQEINAQTGTTYTLVAGDAGKLVTLSNASGITLTVPQDSDATIAVGVYVDEYQLGAGQVTVAAGTGATLRVSGLTAKARAQYSRFGLQKVSANTWSLFGDLAAA